MNCGQSMSDTIKKSRVAFEDVRVSQANSMANVDLQKYYKMELLQICLSGESLIVPFSVFTASNKTLMATIATILFMLGTGF